MSEVAPDELTEQLLDEGLGASILAIWDGGSALRKAAPGQRIVVGRAPDADLVIDHRSISRRHAALFIGQQLEVEDLGSSNRTTVGGVALAPGARVGVRWSEPIELGGAVLVVRAPKRAAPAGPPRETLTGMASAERMMELVAGTDISVLLLGETGVGKSFAARSIHDRSRRSGGPFLHINCAALPANLLEAEFFGYERGAFTGADQAKPGLLEAASGGTVFLDELAELPAPVQAKLLVALEGREVVRLGAFKPRPFDVRFITATNAPLEELAQAGAFRRDLYFRLAGLPVVVPPLRERRAEIPALVARFLSDSCRRLGRPEPLLTADALARLVGYGWPGNIRELATVVERSLLWAGATLEPAHLQLADGGGASHPADVPLSERSLSADVRETEKRRIMAALDQFSGNQSRAAAALGIARGTLISRMVEFGIPRPRKR